MLPPLEPPLNLMSLIISVKFLRMSDTNILAGLEGIMGLEMLWKSRILAETFSFYSIYIDPFICPLKKKW